MTTLNTTTRQRQHPARKPGRVDLRAYLTEGLAHLAADWNGEQAAADRKRDER